MVRLDRSGGCRGRFDIGKNGCRQRVVEGDGDEPQSGAAALRQFVRDGLDGRAGVDVDALS